MPSSLRRRTGSNVKVQIRVLDRVVLEEAHFNQIPPVLALTLGPEALLLWGSLGCQLGIKPVRKAVDRRRLPLSDQLIRQRLLQLAGARHVAEHRAGNGGYPRLIIGDLYTIAPGHHRIHFTGRWSGGCQRSSPCSSASPRGPDIAGRIQVRVLRVAACHALEFQTCGPQPIFVEAAGSEAVGFRGNS